MDVVIDRLEWYESILREDRSSSIFAELAELLYEDGRFDEVIEVCKKGLIAHPCHLKGKIYLGLALMSMGRREESIRVLKEIEKDFRSYAKFFKTLSDIYKEEGKSTEADRLASLAHLLDPHHKEAFPFPDKEKALSLSIQPESVPPAPVKHPLIDIINRIHRLVEEKLNTGVVEATDSKIILEEDRKLIISYIEKLIH